MLASHWADMEDARRCSRTDRLGRKLAMTLYILIPMVWVGALALLVAICRTARDGDRVGSDERQRSVDIGPKLVLGGAATKAAQPRRRTHAQRAQQLSGRTRRSRAAHAAR
jgi:hypothetical protein